MKTIIVTGGAGFIFSHFIRKLLKSYPDYLIINIDCLTYCGNLLNTKDFENNPNYKFIQVSINDYDKIGEIFKEYKPEIVISAASETHVDNSIKNPKSFIETDVLGVFNIAYWALKTNVKRVIHISTDEVVKPFKEEEVSIDAKLNPGSPYAASKACSELLIKSYINTYNLPAIIIRPCNAYGPNQYAEKLIPTTIARLASGKKALLHGSGKEIREWLYVDDICRAVDYITHYGKLSEVYHVGSEYRLTNLQVIIMIIKYMFGNVDYSKFIEQVQNRPGNDHLYKLDSSKTIDEFGDYRVVNFKDGLKLTIQWYLNNPDFWKNIDLECNRYNGSDYLR